MFEVTREIHFCYGHRLPNHQGKCRHLHGHNARVLITLAAKQLDSLGMVIDFSEIKLRLGAWINEHLDHRMLLHREDPLVAVLRQHDEPVFVMDNSPTAENIARLLYETGRALGMPITRVQLWETHDCVAAFSPNEGDKK